MATVADGCSSRVRLRTRLSLRAGRSSHFAGPAPFSTSGRLTAAWHDDELASGGLRVRGPVRKNSAHLLARRGAIPISAL
jgi:hypothetical protein